MARSYFKKVFSYLSNLYPNTKVFVISDEHFFHDNIIKYSRGEFKSTDEMNETIINRHNSVVGPDDIVIFLGDFCFKNNQIANMTSRLNGHKFLVLGNHDIDRYQKKYPSLGFENVFTHPIQFEDLILSHEPITDESKDLLKSLMKKEFEHNKNMFNYYGHEHVFNHHDRGFNVCAENVKYRPTYIGSTGDLKDAIKSPLIIDSDAFTVAVNYLTTEKHVNEKILLADFIYAMCLEGMQAYKDDTVFFGSYSLFKKYGSLFNFSDLDGTVLFNPDISKKGNTENLKGASECAFTTLNNFSTCHPAYDKRMSGIYILSNLFTNGYYHDTQFVDLNMIYRPVYKDTDYVTIEGNTYFENQLRKFSSELADEYYFPHFEVNVLNASGDLANLLLQFLFQKQDSVQRKYLIKKIKVVASNIDFSNFDVAAFEDQVIRFLLKNIYFFDMVNRRSEINQMLECQNDLMELYNAVPKELLDLFFHIVYDSDFKRVYQELVKTGSLRDTCDDILQDHIKR